MASRISGKLLESVCSIMVVSRLGVQGSQARVAFPVMVSQPSWSWAQSSMVLPSAEGLPCTLKACRSKVGRTALNSKDRDRKSTRLNSSHLVISYAVFCLKKKKQYHTGHAPADSFYLRFHR